MLELQPMAEAAADELVVERHLLGIMAGDPAHLDLKLARDLMAGPDLDAAFGNEDDCVQRLQRGVGDVGDRYSASKTSPLAESCVHVSIIAPDPVEVIVGEAFGEEAPVILLFGRVRGHAPFICDRVERPERPPSVVGDHRNATRDLDDVLNATHLARLVAS
jgi:hypothetical protein